MRVLVKKREEVAVCLHLQVHTKIKTRKLHEIPFLIETRERKFMSHLSKVSRTCVYCTSAVAGWHVCLAQLGRMRGGLKTAQQCILRIHSSTILFKRQRTVTMHYSSHRSQRGAGGCPAAFLARRLCANRSATGNPRKGPTSNAPSSSPSPPPTRRFASGGR